MPPRNRLRPRYWRCLRCGGRRAFYPAPEERTTCGKLVLVTVDGLRVRTRCPGDTWIATDLDITPPGQAD